MNVTTINSIGKYTHIIHIADIHIRLTKRHDEYKQVFSELYRHIDSSPPTTLVAILGDLFHNKTDLTPECIQVAADFLTEVASRRDTIIIAGNHDATLNNKSRLDCITPIVNAVNHKNLFYLKANGLFRLGNILFNNYSIFTEPNEYIDGTKIAGVDLIDIDYKIALYHGPVQDAMTDVGFRVSSKTVANESFDGHHIVLLGDIHKYQMLQERSINYRKPVIVYPGSMIQQNHGEAVEGHGFVMWELSEQTFEHVELKNEYGYVTVDVERGELLSDTSVFPKKVNLRVKCRETVPSELKLLMEKIHSKHNILDVVYEKTDSLTETPKNIIDRTSLQINHINDIDYQNRLIVAYLRGKCPNLTDTHYDNIRSINAEINREVAQGNVSKNLRWKPKRFEFENMFSYGDGNVIDFSKLNGIVGLFAANASGKSSILSALSYCIFDKCDRAFKASHILNSQKMSFNCKFNFEIEGIDYFIERRGIQDKKGNVKVIVKFYKRENGNDVDLNGEARRNTNDIIRDYLGTYDDFLLTVLSVQGSAAGFIDMGQAERKDLIAKFMGITIFDQLDSLAKDKTKEISTLLKNYVKGEYPRKLELTIQNIQQLEKSTLTQNFTIEKLTEKIQLERDVINENTLKIIPLTAEVSGIDKLPVAKEEILARKERVKHDMHANITNRDQLTAKLASVVEKLNTFDVEDITRRKEKADLLDRDIRQLESSVTKSDAQLKSNTAKLDKLKTHTYDPNCVYCMNNIFVKDAINTERIINEQIAEHTKLTDQLSSLTSARAELGDVSAMLSEINSIGDEKNYIENKQLHCLNAILKSENEISSLELKLAEIDSRLKIYEENRKAIETNIQLEAVINKAKVNLHQLEQELKKINQQYVINSSDLRAQQESKITLEDTIRSAKAWELQLESYQYYTTAISRDGIPYDLISQILPTIESEINTILRNIVEFTVSLETDGKNVSGFINYGGIKWAMETGSGLEKFVLSLAIRVALLNISNLPRPGFIAIDEGFGCADKDNLNSMGVLLQHFKTHFDFIWIVSHLDSLRDVAETQLEINKVRGFSKILHL